MHDKFTVAFLLISAHFMADYSLQGDTMSVQKSYLCSNELSKHVPWYYWLLSHSLIHGLAVFLITHSLAFGVVETIAHFAIDTAKCGKKINIHVDQALHLATKLAFLLLM